MLFFCQVMLFFCQLHKTPNYIIVYTFKACKAIHCPFINLCSKKLFLLFTQTLQLH